MQGLLRREAARRQLRTAARPLLNDGINELSISTLLYQGSQIVMLVIAVVCGKNLGKNIMYVFNIFK